MLAETEAPLLSTRPVGEDIDELYALDQEIDRLAEKLKEKQKVYDGKAALLMERLDNEGVKAVGGSRAKVSVVESVVAQVENWDELYTWIRRNNAFHMLQRRVSDGAYRELMATRKQPLPGVVPWTKRRLSLRAN